MTSPLNNSLSSSAKKSLPYSISVFVLGVACVVQVAIDSSFVNLSAVVLLYTAFLCSSFYLERLRISSCPNSFFILLGFVTGFCVMPLLLRSLEGNSLVDGLYEPMSTFGSIFLFTLATLISHFLYINTTFLVQSRLFFSKVVRPYFNQTPRLLPILLIAFFGLIALFVSSASDGVFSKLLKAFTPLINLPLAVYLVGYLQGKADFASKLLSRQLLVIVTIFYVFSLFVGMYFNSRYAFVQPLIIVFSALVFSRLGLSKPLRAKTILSVLAIFLIFNSFLSNLSDSIALARAYRASVSPAELVSMTIVNMTNTKTKNVVYEDKSLWWDEQYYDNEFPNRFSPIKNLDNLLHIQKSFDTSRVSEYATIQFVRLVSILPNPLPSFFGVTADQKEEVNQFSSADVLFGFVSSSTVGRRLTGSFISDSLILFGLFAPLIYGFLMLLVFPLSDIFLIPLRASKDLVIPSPLGMLLSSQNILFFTSLTTVDMSVGYGRTLLQTSLAFFASSLLFSRISSLLLKVKY